MESRYRFVAYAAVALVTGTAGAAEKGQIGLHFGTSRDRDSSAFGITDLQPSYGFSYQATEWLSLHPGFSLGHSSLGGWFYSLGSQVRYNLRPGHIVSPYIGASLSYKHDDAAFDTTPSDRSRRYATVGSTAGLEFSISRRFGLFTELGVSHSTGRQYDFESSGWRPASYFQVRPMVGFTVKLR